MSSRQVSTARREIILEEQKESLNKSEEVAEALLLEIQSLVSICDRFIVLIRESPEPQTFLRRIDALLEICEELYNARELHRFHNSQISLFKERIKTTQELMRLFPGY